MKIGNLIDLNNLFKSVEQIGLRVTGIQLSSATIFHFEVNHRMVVGFNRSKGKLVYEIWGARVFLDDSLPDMEVIVNKTEPLGESDTILLYEPCIREC